MSHIYMEFSKSIQSTKKHYFYSHQKPTKLFYEIWIWFPLFYGGSWRTSSWFLLSIESAQLIRRRVKIYQLWICFSFWWNIFSNRLTAVCIDICYSLSWCLYWELFTFRIKLKAPPPSNEWFYFGPPLSWQQFYVMLPPLVFQPPPPW